VSVPPRDLLAAKVRELIEMHGEWDSLHQFVTLHWDGERLSYGTVALIDPHIHPDQYPPLMIRMARERLGEHPDDPPYAYVLQIECFGAVDPGPDASEEERRRFDADRRGRTFYKRPDALEMAIAYCVDIHGRFWTAGKVRGKEDRIEEHFYRPGAELSGQFIRALKTVAATTGVIAHGLRPTVRGETWN